MNDNSCVHPRFSQSRVRWFLRIFGTLVLEYRDYGYVASLQRTIRNSKNGVELKGSDTREWQR